MLTRLFESSRYLLFIAVAGSFLASIAVLIFGAVDLLRLTGLVLNAGLAHEKGSKLLAVAVTELIDLFLLGTVLYVISIGLYELFIDPRIKTPDWLHIESLDDLKEKLIAVLVVLLAVTFLGQVVEWQSGTDILAVGAAIALVSGVLVWLLTSSRGHGTEKEWNGETRGAHREKQGGAR